ncbi:MAG: alpha/beta fold hydrolase [Gammaproteobacteria bacterium]|nr:alpha/beta fold hydrolase [Gammaproteobacteria bacterium]MDE0441882.1 alpha/beta fold hydrolase [Gammaproteobacteria bacterium]
MLKPRRAVALAMAALCSLPAAGAEPPPVAAFAALPDVEGITISPTGRYLTASIRQGENAQFQIVTLPEREMKVNVALGDKREVTQVVWLTDQVALFQQAWRVMGTDYKVPTGALATVHAETGFVQPAGGGSVIDILPEEPDHILVHMPENRFGLAYRLDIRSRHPRQVARSAAPFGTFVPDADGNILVTVGQSNDNRRQIHTRPAPRKRWGLVASFGLEDEAWLPMRFGPRPNSYYTLDSRGGPTEGLGIYDATTGQHQLIIRHPTVDVTTLLVDPAARDVYGVRFDHHYPQIAYTDPSHPLAGQHFGLTKMFEGDTVQIVSATRDRRQAIALVTGDRRPGDYFLVSTESKKVELLKSRKPQLKPESLSRTSPIELQVRDGTTIYGYVTSSPKAERPGPMVVYVHGGPHGMRDYWGYDDTVQLLASRGFHVLQVNFRGSGGYGVDYERAGYGEWGRRMQDDVTDATRWAVQNDIADPNRICVFGASYGAYSAMMGSIREPGLYRCALGMYGIYDLTLMQKQGDVSRTLAGEKFIRRILRADENDLIATSPLHQADRIGAKVMLVHGGLDERAPPEHATRLRRALIRSGNEPEWLFDRQQGHGFLGDAARVDLFQRMLAFFQEHTRGGNPPSSTKDGDPAVEL